MKIVFNYSGSRNGIPLPVYNNVSAFVCNGRKLS